MLTSWERVIENLVAMMHCAALIAILPLKNGVAPNAPTAIPTLHIATPPLRQSLLNRCRADQSQKLDHHQRFAEFQLVVLTIVRCATSTMGIASSCRSQDPSKHARIKKAGWRTGLFGFAFVSFREECYNRSLLGFTQQIHRLAFPQLL